MSQEVRFENHFCPICGHVIISNYVKKGTLYYHKECYDLFEAITKDPYPVCEKCKIQTNGETGWYDIFHIDLCGKCQKEAELILRNWLLEEK